MSSLNTLSNLFSQYKISLCWRNTNDVSSFIVLAKTVAASQHKRERKNILSSFWHWLGHESACAPLCKLASCTRQLFLSKLKLLQTWQRGRKNNKKKSKAEISYDYALFWETHKLSRYQRRELSCINFIHKSKAYAYN